jgi:hypothetical protein
VDLATELGSTSYEGDIQGGGCYLISQAAIIGDITQCYEGSGDIVSNFPTVFPYEASEGSLQVLLAYPIDVILSSLESDPEVYAIASAILVNDLEAILIFNKF